MNYCVNAPIKILILSSIIICSSGKEGVVDIMLTSVSFGQLESLSVFLGELMIMLFEERKTLYVQSLCQDDDHLLLDAQKSVEFRQKDVMLHLLDAYWANFLRVSPICGGLHASSS